MRTCNVLDISATMATRNNICMCGLFLVCSILARHFCYPFAHKFDRYVTEKLPDGLGVGVTGWQSVLNKT